MKRLDHLREELGRAGLAAYLVLNADPHASEYLPDFYKSVGFLSGFSGSAGSLIVTAAEAYLFTDGRYFIQAEKELEGSGFNLQREGGGKTVFTWLENFAAKAGPEAFLGVDFATLSLANKKKLEKIIKIKNTDLIPAIYEATGRVRPALPRAAIYAHEAKFTSASTAEKLAQLRKKMREAKAAFHLISSLDDLAWLTNLRGGDVEFNPIFLAHLLVPETGPALLFVDPAKLSDELMSELKTQGLEIKNYTELNAELKKLKNTTLLLEPAKVAAASVAGLDESVSIIEQLNPSTTLKSIKSNKEQDFIALAMREDGVALCRFFAWLEKELINGEGDLSEIDIDVKLQEFRSRSEFYVSDSFPTIAGFGANSALPHYRARPASFAYLKQNGVAQDGLLLIDSGAQYRIGTTDITRVVGVGRTGRAFLARAGGLRQEEEDEDLRDVKSLGQLELERLLAEAWEQIRDYTLVLKAHIALARASFPEGLPLPLLDALTRAPLWERGLDFMHGTGHGVGYFLNVHEGPQTISYFAEPSEKTRASPGQLTSIEPGIYREGQWGVRLENLVINERKIFSPFHSQTLTSADKEQLRVARHIDKTNKEWLKKDLWCEDNTGKKARQAEELVRRLGGAESFGWGARLDALGELVEGGFLCFRSVTLCPFEPDLIDPRLLDETEKAWLNKYHHQVREALSPLLGGPGDEDALAWLEKKTQILE